MRILKAFPLLFFITVGLGAQNYIDYYNQANEAEHLFESGNFISARSVLLRLEKQYEQLKPLENFYLGIMDCFDADTNGYAYLIKAAESGFQAASYAKSFQLKYPTLFISKLISDRLLAIQNQMENRRDKKTEDTLKYFNEQDALHGGDLTFFNGQNKISQKQFLLYLQNSGFPNEFLYGDWPMRWLIPHVSAYPYDSSLYKGYRDFLFQEVKKGTIGPSYYCEFIDRNLEEIGQTMYGAYKLKFTATTSKEEVILNRKKIGLSPYHDDPGRLFVRYPRF